jgi:hypothetical protein
MTNLKNLKHKIKKKEVYEYYYMKNIYSNKTFLIKDYIRTIKKLGGGKEGYQNMHSSKIYKVLLNEITKKNIISKQKEVSKFLSKNNYKLGFEY